MTSAVAAVGSPASLARPTLVAGSAALIATALAVMFLIGVLIPRLPRHRDSRRVSYFGDVARIHDCSAQEERGENAFVNVETAVRMAATNALTHTVDELAAVSKIAWLKYRHVRNAIICLGVAAVSLGLAALSKSCFAEHPTRPAGHRLSCSAGSLCFEALCSSA
ncbi:MAG: Pycsar system effector family protein [Egibacteraceae bacterium]